MPDGDVHLDAIATLATLTKRLVDLRGFELNQIKAKVALKVLDIEQLGLPTFWFAVYCLHPSY